MHFTLYSCVKGW